MTKTFEEILAREKPEVVANAMAKASDILIDINLAAIREWVNITQCELAQAMNVKQPTIANMEKQGHDMKLSSLKRYIEAVGGKLRFNVELPNGKKHDFSI